MWQRSRSQRQGSSGGPLFTTHCPLPAGPFLAWLAGWFAARLMRLAGLVGGPCSSSAVSSQLVWVPASLGLSALRGRSERARKSARTGPAHGFAFRFVRSL